MATISDLEEAGYEVGLVRSSPDIAQPDVYSISGKGFYGIMVRVDPNTGLGYEPDDQETLDSIHDPVVATERCFQCDEPEAAAARSELQAKGYEVERADPLVDEFTITGLNGPVLVPADELAAANEDAPPIPDGKRHP